jgi:hypothetical protein
LQFPWLCACSLCGVAMKLRQNLEGWKTEGQRTEGR